MSQTPPFYGKGPSSWERAPLAVLNSLWSTPPVTDMAMISPHPESVRFLTPPGKQSSRRSVPAPDVATTLRRVLPPRRDSVSERRTWREGIAAPSPPQQRSPPSDKAEAPPIRTPAAIDAGVGTQSAPHGPWASPAVPQGAERFRAEQMVEDDETQRLLQLRKNAEDYYHSVQSREVSKEVHHHAMPPAFPLPLGPISSSVSQPAVDRRYSSATRGCSAAYHQRITSPRSLRTPSPTSAHSTTVGGGRGPVRINKKVHIRNPSPTIVSDPTVSPARRRHLRPEKIVEDSRRPEPRNDHLLATKHQKWHQSNEQRYAAAISPPRQTPLLSEAGTLSPVISSLVTYKF